MRFDGIPKQKSHFVEDDFLSIDDRIVKSTTNISKGVTYDRGGNPIGGGMVNGFPAERPLDMKMIENDSEILSLLMKASGQSQHVVPSFYEGGDDVYIENKKVVDVTVTDGDRRAIHTISNYYNTLGIYRDDFDKTNNDKLARNAYYAICEKAMMDYMRSIQWSVKDNRNGDTVDSATDFFNCPNPQDEMGDMMASLIRDITRYDAGVMVKTFNKGGFCVEMKPYLATEFWREQDRVPFIVNVPIMNTVDLTGGAYASHQQPTYQGWWSHGYTERFWQRSRTGVYIPFQPEEICYFMMYPRTDSIYGTDFLKFLKYQIQYLIDSTKAAGKTFENGIVPSLIWEHPEVHTIQQLKTRIAELKYNNQGWQRFGSVVHTVNGEKVSSLAQSLVDMQWLEGQKFVAQLVWATWGFSPEEFMGGGENRASSYVKRNITKSRLLYPLMTFLESRINKEILPFLKGYRKFWKFTFVRDIELDDEQKVATTNSIKASTFLQYYGAGFPIEASMELSGLDKNKYKFDIDLLEAEILQNQMMMLGQQPGEQGAGGLEDQEAGRYGPGSEGYVDAGVGDTGQGAAQSDRDPRDPSIDEEQYKKATLPIEKSWGNTNEAATAAEDSWNRQKQNEPKEEPKEEKGKGLMARGAKGAVDAVAGAAKKVVTTVETAAKMAVAGPAGAAEGAAAQGAMAEGAAEGASKLLAAKADTGEVEKGLLKRTLHHLLTRGNEGLKDRYDPKPKGKEKKNPNRKLGDFDDETHETPPKGEGEKRKEPEQRKQSPKVETTKDVGKPQHAVSDRRQGVKPPMKELHQDSDNVWKSLKMGEKDVRQDMDYDPVQLAEGIRVEMEHTRDPDVAKEIAKDHLDEFDGYYTSLKKMENGLRKAGHPFERVSLYVDSQNIVKAKVYITHPSEAPKGRPVRRGNKGGYYYITNQRERGGAAATQTGERTQKQKPKHAKGWGSSGGQSGETQAQMPPPPPSIEGAEEQISITGNGVGVVAATISGRLVVKKLNNGPTNMFLKIVEKKSGENPLSEKIIEVMIMTAQEMGLEIQES